jgi:hypothetical protein
VCYVQECAINTYHRDEEESWEGRWSVVDVSKQEQWVGLLLIPESRAGFCRTDGWLELFLARIELSLVKILKTMIDDHIIIGR